MFMHYNNTTKNRIRNKNKNLMFLWPVIFSIKRSMANKTPIQEILSVSHVDTISEKYNKMIDCHQCMSSYFTETLKKG